MLGVLRDLIFPLFSPLQPAPEEGSGCVNLKVWNCTVLEMAVNPACSFSVDNEWTRTINSEIKATGGSCAPHFCLPLLSCALLLPSLAFASASIHLILIVFSLLSNHALFLALIRKQASPALSFVRCATQTSCQLPRRADVSGDNDTRCGVAGTRSSSGGRLWRGRHGTQSTRARC